MFVGEIMAQDLITIVPEKPISEALELMIHHNVRHIPVVDSEDEKKLVGIITAHDVKRNISMKGDDSILHKLNPTPIGKIMKKEVITVTSKTYVQDAARIIYGKKIGGIPVVDKKKLVGIISYQDIIGVFIEMMDGLQESARIDVEVKDLKAVEEIKLLLEGEECEMIGIGLVRENEKSEIYSFRIKHRETEPLYNLLSAAGYEVVEHFC